MDLEQLYKEKEHLSEMMFKHVGFGLMLAKKDALGLIHEEQYYKYKKLFEINRHKISKFLDKIKENKAPVEKTEKTKVKREITSTTYIRAQNRLFKNHDSYFGRGMN
ncbi:hypothetical protein [Chryseobacterium indologenes]|uniref:hypothetical protein n=1 Tax=Chryseobacterium indologenes TaxID=253 RepID=UPI0009A1D3D0|nr:hypothetical protein [Chryseobacterium indologenes]